MYEAIQLNVNNMLGPVLFTLYAIWCMNYLSCALCSHISTTVRIFLSAKLM